MTLNVISETATHKVESAGTIYIPTKKDICLEWQDGELKKYDNKLQPDRPNADRILEYREELRQYILHVDFPNNERPEL